MSQENVEVVRQPLSMRERSRRTLDQRLSLRFPAVGAAAFRVLTRLPPRSRLRQAALARAARLQAEAYNRRDLDAAVIGAHPDFEFHPARTWIDSGLVESCYRGREGYRRYVAASAEVWGEQIDLKPVELIDLGERFVVLATTRMRGQVSGVPLTENYAYVGTLKDGRVTHVQEYFDHAEALEAVGLSEQDAHAD
jgi:ketosteroid isomerase-like protein